MTDKDIDAQSVSTDSVNGFVYAESPDDIDTQLNNLGSRGGWVVLTSGDYTDADFSTQITIPDKDFVGIDMSAANITLTSFNPSGPYIARGTSTGNGLSRNPVHIVGPALFDVTGLSDPPTFLELWNIQNSRVYIPKIEGPVEYAVEHHTDDGSSHMNQFAVFTDGARSGYRVEGHRLSNDRCYYFGQLKRLSNVGFEGIDARQNHLHVQAEDDASGEFATGIKLDNTSHNNTIYKAHNRTSRPLDIQGLRNRLKYEIQPGGPEKTLIDSKPAIKPTAWESMEWQTTAFKFDVDWTSVLDTAGDGSATVGAFNRLTLDSGTLDGNTQPIQTQSRLGNPGVGYLASIKLQLQNTSNAVYRWGFQVDANNFVMAEADTENESTWTVIVNGGGTETDITTTSKPIDTDTHELIAMVSNNSQYVAFDGEHIAEGTQDISGLGNPLKHRADVHNVGGTGSGRQLQIFELSHMGR